MSDGTLRQINYFAKNSCMLIFICGLTGQIMPNKIMTIDEFG